MPTPHLILFGYVLPALLPLAGVLIAWVVGSRSRGGTAGAAVAGLAAAGALLAFALGFRVASESATWLPPTSSDAAAWAYYAAAVLAVLALLDGALRPPTWLRAIVLLFGVRVLLRLFLAPLYGHSLTPVVAEGWIDGLGLAVVVNVIGLDVLVDRRPISGTLAGAILAAGWSAFLLSATYNIRGSFAAASAVGAFIATACGVALTTLLDARRARRAGSAADRGAVTDAVGGLSANRTAAFVRAATPSFGLLLVPVLLLATWCLFYQSGDASASELTCGAVLLLAPLAAFAGELPGVRRRGAVFRGVVRIVVVAAVVAAAAGTTIHAYMHSPAGSGTESGYEGE